MTTQVRTASVWDDLVGQEVAVQALQRAVAAAHGKEDPFTQKQSSSAMSHAWLVSGPAGSGRSNAAVAFAAALQCAQGGCGVCSSCKMVAGQVHPDVTLVRTEKLSIGVDEVRELVRKSALSPSLQGFQIIVIEDADRITVEGANALLKGVEEPAARTVWILCAPTSEDVVVTIRSRCRELRLVTPSDQEVSALLQTRDGVDVETANWAARVAQGHIGRAKRLATDPAAREYREQVLGIPGSLTSLGACLVAADRLVKVAKSEADEQSSAIDQKETAELREMLGGQKGTRARGVSAALKELEKDQKARATRIQRDVLDGALTELTTWFRDVLTLQLSASEDRIVNIDRAKELWQTAEKTSPEATLGKIDAILDAREALGLNATQLLVIENLMIKLA